MAVSSVRSLQRRTGARQTTDDSPQLTVPDDPLGLDVQARGMENARANMLPFGPLPDPKWAGFFQALADRGVQKLAAGPSAPVSNQLRGRPLQPWTWPGTAGDALEGVARSMPWYVPPPPPPPEEPVAAPTAPKKTTKAPPPPPKDQGQLLP